MDDVLHVRALSTDGLVGLSPLKQCRLAVDYARGMSESAAALTSNGFLPAGILKLPATSREHLKELKEGFEQRHGGARNMHRIALVTGDVQWTGLSIPADDLQFVEQRELSTREICRVFGVPPHLIGANSGDSLTYSNAEMQALQFATYSLRPWLVLIEQAITQDPDLCFERQYVEFFDGRFVACGLEDAG
jgi:HK97 family phage portal protein